jgi:di- and tripeptidase
VIYIASTLIFNQTDLHSGVDGGAVDEPLNDLIKLLNQLISNDKKVLIPGFNDDVRPINEREMGMLSALIEQ